MTNPKSARKVKIFHSFEEENLAETHRRKNMPLNEILNNFAILQQRRWGKDWYKKPIVKKAVMEKIF